MGTKEKKQGITNTLDLPKDKMLYIYQPCPHSEQQKISVQIDGCEDSFVCWYPCISHV